MKKIILTGIISFCLLNTAFSQNATGAPAGARVMTVAEANSLNGVAQPTINGVPYTQFKTQQDALKNKPATKQEAAVILPVTAINPDDLKNIRKEDKPVVKQPASKDSN